MTTSPLVLAVNPATGIRSVAELIAAAKKDPGKLNYSTSGNGSAPHLGAALFSQLTGAEMTHIPYRGGALAIQSVMAGDTQVTFGTSPSVLPQASGGRLRALAVSTRERSPLVPDLPGMKEAGLPEYNLEFWYGMFVPAGTPPAIVKKIYDATITAMQQPSVKAALAREGTEVSLSASPEQFASFLAEDGKFWVEPGQERQRQGRMNCLRLDEARPRASLTLTMHLHIVKASFVSADHLARRPVLLQLLHALAQGLQFGAQLLKLRAPVRSRRDASLLLATGLNAHGFRSRAQQIDPARLASACSAR